MFVKWIRMRTKKKCLIFFKLKLCIDGVWNKDVNYCYFVVRSIIIKIKHPLFPFDLMTVRSTIRFSLFFAPFSIASRKFSWCHARCEMARKERSLNESKILMVVKDNSVSKSCCTWEDTINVINQYVTGEEISVNAKVR